MEELLELEAKLYDMPLVEACERMKQWRADWARTIDDMNCCLDPSHYFMASATIFEKRHIKVFIFLLQQAIRNIDGTIKYMDEMSEYETWDRLKEANAEYYRVIMARLIEHGDIRRSLVPYYKSLNGWLERVNRK